MRRCVASLAAAIVAYALYSSTLLPGQDLGDTAVFQVIAASGARPTARDAYPLYYFLGRRAAATDPANPAAAVNRLSAIAAALAAGALAWIAATVTGSATAALSGALLLASSYTFWTQAIIAETYTLHLLLALAAMAVLIAWSRRLTTAMLVVFFAIYGLSFGNHLSTVLLLPGFAVFILIEACWHRDGLASVLRARIVLLAMLCAAAGALQYAPMFQALWHYPQSLGSVTEVFHVLWRDVTKADWRESLVMGIRRDQIPDRLAMYWFDLRQQFGAPAVLVAVTGLINGVRAHQRIALMLVLAYLATFLFAFSYNVGDTHVFYLTSHAIVAIWFACGVAFLASSRHLPPEGGSHEEARRRLVLVASGFLTAVALAKAVSRKMVFAATLAYIGWRVVDTYPAVDRSDDRQAEQFFATMTAGLTSTRDVFVADLNWQQIDGLAFYSTMTNPDLAWSPAAAVLPHFPTFVRDNHEIGRTVVLNGSARDRVLAMYGTRFAIQPDPRPAPRSMTGIVRNLHPGTAYAMTLVTPYPGATATATEIGEVVRQLTGSDDPGGEARRRFIAAVGRVGASPVLVRAEDRPFRTTTVMDRWKVHIRFDAWPVFDTIRRAGFGLVLVNRRGVLRIDRGLSLAILDADGRPQSVSYRGGILEPQQRFIIRP